MNHCKTCAAFCRENEQLRARIAELEAIAAGAVMNAAERAVDLMAAQRGFNEGHTVDV